MIDLIIYGFVSLLIYIVGISFLCLIISVIWLLILLAVAFAKHIIDETWKKC